MTLPTLQVLLDNGTGTFPLDITSKALAIDGYSISRGRADWQGAVTAGQLSLNLNNSDGRFTPGSTILATPSPITVDQQIRVKETVNGVTYTRFTGYVKAWPVVWPAVVSTFSTVQLAAVDAQPRAERRVLRSLLEEEILLDSPLAYYPLSEAEGSTSAGDIAGFQAAPLGITGTGAPMTFGVGTGPGTDGLTAATFANGQYLTDGNIGSTSIPTHYTLACWFNTSTFPTSSSVMVLSNGWSLTIDTSGHLVAGGPGFTGLTSPTVVADGLTHFATLTGDGTAARLELDSTGAGTAVLSATTGTPVMLVGTGFTGVISHVATWLSALSLPQISAINIAGAGIAESGPDRITRLAGYAGIPVGTFDASLTTVPTQATSGKSGFEAIQEAVDAEAGLAFVDGSGSLVFHNRNRVASKTVPDLTLDRQWVTPDVQPVVDDQQLINYSEVTTVGTGATQVVQNATSDATHGRYSDSRSYLVQTDQESLDRANWIVGNFAEPSPRYGTLTINLYGMTPAQASTVVSKIEINCWLRVTSLASQNPGGTTADVVVQSWSEESTAESWSITCNVVARSLYTAWILGDSTYSVLGSTTRLYF